ncbi:unnamed protein product [Paramecium octaurelia]|uniref:Uncharacterized protein n=1 Tax=Paramecium octaurelia TaxID=43137 RepID=A0A8S1WUM7_PAROT|nr:unnamed protein product [Paramecium octaurelia]
MIKTQVNPRFVQNSLLNKKLQLIIKQNYSFSSVITNHQHFLNNRKFIIFVDTSVIANKLRSYPTISSKRGINKLTTLLIKQDVKLLIFYFSSDFPLQAFDEKYKNNIVLQCSSLGNFKHQNFQHFLCIQHSIQTTQSGSVKEQLKLINFNLSFNSVINQQQ